jgi:hypothetical protein
MYDVFHPCSHNLLPWSYPIHTPTLISCITHLFFLTHSHADTLGYSWSCNPTWSRELLKDMTNEGAADETTAVLRTWPPFFNSERDECRHALPSFGSSYAGQCWRLQDSKRWLPVPELPFGIVIRGASHDSRRQLLLFFRLSCESQHTKSIVWTTTLSKWKCLQ